MSVLITKEKEKSVIAVLTILYESVDRLKQSDDSHQNIQNKVFTNLFTHET